MLAAPALAVDLKELPQGPLIELTNLNGPYDDGAFQLTALPPPLAQRHPNKTQTDRDQAVHDGKRVAGSYAGVAVLDLFTSHWRPGFKSYVVEGLHNIASNNIGRQAVSNPPQIKSVGDGTALVAVGCEGAAIGSIGFFTLATMHNTVRLMGGYRMVRGLLGHVLLRPARQ